MMFMGRKRTINFVIDPSSVQLGIPRSPRFLEVDLFKIHGSSALEQLLEIP